jgi:branched-chain amino acid aminotransferase|tara:strand:- start:1963 stop:2940 length:978 start_codon:yes stop_codon:yes gene_type:complete
MSNQRIVYLNGNFVPEQEARISIYDSALMFGDMVFEMTRSFQKKQFKLKEHLERLFIGIKILRIPLKMSIGEMEKICCEVIERNDPVFSKTDEHRLMINVSRGPLSIYAPIFGGKVNPTVSVADFPLKWTVSGMGKLFDEGINAVVPSQRAIPANLLEPKIKNRSRVHYQMANIEASQFKGDNNWALLLDPDGYIAEGTGDNFFIAKNGVISTPQGRNILRGISRQYIFELAKQLKMDCREANIEPYDVYSADEAFMTGTPFCLLPVGKLNSLEIGDGKVGVVTKLLLETWSKNVGVDIVQQIKDFNQEVGELDINAASPYVFSS